MIFVTIGTQLPFNRLIKAIDEWAKENQGVEIFAQIGNNAYIPKNFKSTPFLKSSEVISNYKKCELVISHAGMGSVLSAMTLQKPIIIMPRKASLGEHRNEHQIATAKWLEKKEGVTVCWNEMLLPSLLDNRSSISHGPLLPEYASGPLIDKLSQYINSTNKKNNPNN